MIVKVQVQLAPEPGHNALVYNQSRTRQALLPITKSLLDIMKGRTKAFFHAKIEKKVLVIGTEAPWQDW